MVSQYFTSLLVWVVVVWLLWMVGLSIRKRSFKIPGFINVFLAATLIHAIAWLLGFSVADLLPFQFSDDSMIGHEEMVEVLISIFVDEFLSWILVLVSLFLIALRIKR